MKDSVAWACLLLCGLPLAAAGQQVINNGGQIIINGQPLFINQQGGLMMRFGNPAAKPEMLPAPRGDVLEFTDGSALHGTLARMDLQHGLKWSSPEAENPVDFRPGHIDFIRFARAQSVSLTPTCHLWFSNGDDLYGSITSMDNERLGFSAWFGGAMAIPRSAVSAITFLSPNYSVVYEGPYDEGGWMVVNSSLRSWTFHDGAFLGAGPGTLGRELNLTNSTTVEFDLAWSGYFMLEVGIYCDVADRLDVAGGSCVVDLTPKQASLRQVQNMGFPFNMAGAPLPGDEEKNRMRVAIECDKTEGTVSVFIDHLLTKVWKDCNFQGGGTGILFRQQSYLPSGNLKLSGIKISQWETRGEPEAAAPATNADAIYFVNHDRAAGKIESVQDGKVRVALAGSVLEIPLERVTQMEFAGVKPIAEPSSPWEVRAHFPGGGSLSFELEKWDDKEVSGRSAMFGPLSFPSGAIRQVEFNLNRPKQEGVVADTKEFEDLDE